MARGILIALVTAMTLAAAARAQILPRVQIPRLPRVDLPVDVDEVVPGVRRTLDDVREDVRELADVRRLRIRDLIRNNREVINVDPDGAPILRREVLALAPTDAALESARAAGFGVIRERSLEGLDTRVVVLQAPSGMSAERALRELRDLDPEGIYDFNHIYSGSGTLSTQPAISGHGGYNSPQQPSVRMRLGLIDGGVDSGHPVFRDVVIHHHGCEDNRIPSDHGTAVASLMAGHSGKFSGAAPGAELYAADVYCGAPTGGAVDAVAEAFGWLTKQGVPVINVSLVGPRNALLENVVRLVIARGHVVVAAVGNDGPAAPPLYPAAYPDVVGVTGVDARKRALVEAARGRHVDFAAPGADMAAAASAHSFMAVRGTSFASPIVAGLIAAGMAQVSEAGPPWDSSSSARAQKAVLNQVVADLTGQAIDLGARGRDRTYGNGLVGDGVRLEPRLAGIRSR